MPAYNNRLGAGMQRQYSEVSDVSDNPITHRAFTSHRTDRRNGQGPADFNNYGIKSAAAKA